MVQDIGGLNDCEWSHERVYVKCGSRVPANCGDSTSRSHHPNTLHLQQPAHLACKANRDIAFAPRNTTFINRLAITDAVVITNIQ